MKQEKQSEFVMRLTDFCDSYVLIRNENTKENGQFYLVCLDLLQKAIYDLETEDLAEVLECVKPFVKGGEE
jgi:hypothetical protein